jgi:hypothetical protein
LGKVWLNTKGVNGNDITFFHKYICFSQIL